MHQTASGASTCRYLNASAVGHAEFEPHTALRRWVAAEDVAQQQIRALVGASNGQRRRPVHDCVQKALTEGVEVMASDGICETVVAPDQTHFRDDDAAVSSCVGCAHDAVNSSLTCGLFSSSRQPIDAPAYVSFCARNATVAPREIMCA